MLVCNIYLKTEFKLFLTTWKKRRIICHEKPDNKSMRWTCCIRNSTHTLTRFIVVGFVYIIEYWKIKFYLFEERKGNGQHLQFFIMKALVVIKIAFTCFFFLLHKASRLSNQSTCSKGSGLDVQSREERRRIDIY